MTQFTCPNFVSCSSGDTNIRLEVVREISLHQLDCSWPLSSLSISGDGKWLATTCCDGSAACVFSVDDTHTKVPLSEGQRSRDCLWWKIPPRPEVFCSHLLFTSPPTGSDHKPSLLDNINTSHISWCFFCTGTSA